MSTRVALGQLDVRFGDPGANLAIVRDWLRDCEGRADWLVLPELWSTGYDRTRADVHAGTNLAVVLPALQAACRAHGVGLFAGSLLLPHGGAVGNVAVVLGPDGHEIGRYAKTHLFGLMAEPAFLTAGDRLPVLSFPWGPGAVAICYDLRFPEVFRSYAARGARLVVVPAEWPGVRAAHWRALLIARAIENQCYVIGVNRVGADPANAYAGGSIAVDPWGHVVAEAGSEEGLTFAAIDWAIADEVRARISAWPDRRPDLYERPDGL